MIDIKRGNVANPVWYSTHRLIVHCVNDEKIMGAGVAKALYQIWPQVKSEYLDWGEDSGPFKLGQIQIVPCEPSISVCNLIGQRSVGSFDFPKQNISIVAARYEALYEGFVRLRSYIEQQDTEHTLHLPLIGAGLAGGNFRIVFKKYVEVFGKTEHRTCFYAFSMEDFYYLANLHNNYMKDKDD